MLIIFAARRGVPRDVHDGGPEEVLRRHEEDGEEETREGDPETPGNIIMLCFGAAACVQSLPPPHSDNLIQHPFSGDPRPSCFQSSPTRSST